ncbi:MAG: CvpA family protein [Holosporales bacterium]|jgi:membrane protein required for colicin V production|nr:CvpA family protein [Holosporales bacterium]
MNIVDIVIAACVFFSFVVGISRGFIREISSIMAWVLAGVATFWDVPLLRIFIRSKIESALLADILTGASAFVIAFVIISLIGAICSGFVRGTLISPIDRALGALLGATKGIVILCCMEIIAECFVSRVEMPSPMKSSFLVNYYLYGLCDILRPLLPPSVNNYLDSLASKNAALSAVDSALSVEEMGREAFANGATQQPRPVVADELQPVGVAEELSDVGRGRADAVVADFGTLKPRVNDVGEANYTPQQANQLNSLIKGTDGVGGLSGR